MKHDHTRAVVCVLHADHGADSNGTYASSAAARGEAPPPGDDTGDSAAPSIAASMRQSESSSPMLSSRSTREPAAAAAEDGDEPAVALRGMTQLGEPPQLFGPPAHSHAL